MKLKEIFLIVIIVVALIFAIQLVLTGLAYWWYSGIAIQNTAPTPNQLGRDIQLVGVSCTANSHYTLTMKNVGIQTLDISGYNFYVDNARVACEGISSLGPGVSATCTISQFTTTGSHTLDISGPNFSMGQSINC
jgi:hypothetical protein